MPQNNMYVTDVEVIEQSKKSLDDHAYKCLRPRPKTCNLGRFYEWKKDVKQTWSNLYPQKTNEWEDWRPYTRLGVTVFSTRRGGFCIAVRQVLNQFNVLHNLLTKYLKMERGTGLPNYSSKDLENSIS